MTKTITININHLLLHDNKAPHISVEYAMIKDEPFIFSYNIRPTLATLVTDWDALILYAQKEAARIEEASNHILKTA